MSDDMLVSVRELIHELATIEDAVRGARTDTADPRTDGAHHAMAARQEAIIEELRRQSRVPALLRSAPIRSGEPESRLESGAWSNITIGPPGDWPPELVTVVRTLLPSRLPIMICWGEDLVQIYNDAFSLLLGDRHPAAMGQRAADCWAGEWSRIAPKVEEFLAGQEVLLKEELPLFINRHGYLEETYWNLSLHVIAGADNEHQGLMLYAIEDTARVVSDRRLTTIHELSVLSTVGMTSLEEVCQAALNVMSCNRSVLPFAACYLRSSRELRLVASYGAKAGSEAFPGAIACDGDGTIARAARTGLQEVTYHIDEVAEPGSLAASPLGEAAPTSAMLIPLLAIGEMDTFGVLVLGVSPYSAVDSAYRSFFDLVSRQLSTLFTDARAHQEQRRRAERLVVLQESQTRFFQNVSHEFRTPLTLVLGGLECLSIGRSGAESQQLDAAKRATLRLDRLVDALMTFAQAESGALLTQRESTDLAQLTDEAASMFRSAIEEADIEFLVELPDEPLVVDIDREMWSRIVVNLLSNAYKFTAQGRISLKLAGVDGVTLTVQDTGVGIDSDSLARVFQRFQRTQMQPVRNGPGAGIGLCLVADLVRAHLGTVNVTSEPGVGSTFTVSLPLKTSLAAPSGAARIGEHIHAQTVSDIAGTPDTTQWPTDALAAAPVTRDGSGPGPTRRSLLLVEDNGDLRLYLCRLLRNSGWTVHAVPDAESALRHQEVPDIILSDVMLPGRDGLCLVRMIRATPHLAAVPVILLTARAGGQAATEGLRTGADDYIIKPFNADELLARLDIHHELNSLRNYALAQAENQVSNLQMALSSNRKVGAAIGVLMASRKVTSQEAFKLLRQASNETNRKVRDVADSVVLTGSLGPLV